MAPSTPLSARNEIPVAERSKAILYIERPSTCNCGHRSFSTYVRRPDQLHRAMSAKDWARFTSELSEITDRFWNELVGLIPIFMFMFPVLPIAAFMAGVFSLDMNVKELITSDGSKLRPHCSWESQCVWNVAVELACTSRLCRSAGFDHGMLLSASNDMCRSTFTSNISDNTYHVFWDPEDNWGPHLYDRSKGHGLAQITADCVLKHPAPAWGCMTVFGTIPFIVALVIFPFKWINNHNKSIDEEIQDLVFRANSAMPAHTGCRIEYETSCTGLCKPQGVRPWRALIIHGDPGQRSQAPPSERSPLTAPPGASR